MSTLRKRLSHPAMQPVPRPISIVPPSQSDTPDASMNYTTSAVSAAELEARIENALLRMEQASKDLHATTPKSLWRRLFERLKGFLETLFCHLSSFLACVFSKTTQATPDLSMDEQNMVSILRRRTCEGINLTSPKVQCLTGDGKVSRKPGPFQLELFAEIIKEKERRHVSSSGSKDYANFITTGQLEDMSDDASEPFSDSNDDTPVEELLSRIASEPSESITRPFSIKSSNDENWVSHRSASAEPRIGPQGKRISSFFENLRASSPFSLPDRSLTIPVSPKGKGRDTAACQDNGSPLTSGKCLD